MTSSYGNFGNITPEDEAAGGTARQLAARARYRDPNNAPAGFNQLANQSIDAEYKLRPDSTFSQENLDSFNRRQDEARQMYAMQYGAENLQDINRYENVEDIPRYTEEEIRQMNIDSLKANPKSYYNRKNTPLNTNFDRPNQKVPQAVVDSYNSLTSKFRNLRDTGDQSSVTRQDFTNVLDALNNSPAEYIQPGENYAGPDFQNVDGSLQRLDPSSVFYQDPAKTQQSTAPSNNNQSSLMGNSPVGAGMNTQNQGSSIPNPIPGSPPPAPQAAGRSFNTGQTAQPPQQTAPTPAPTQSRFNPAESPATAPTSQPQTRNNTEVAGDFAVNNANVGGSVANNANSPARGNAVKRANRRRNRMSKNTSVNNTSTQQVGDRQNRTGASAEPATETNNIKPIEEPSFAESSESNNERRNQRRENRRKEARSRAEERRAERRNRRNRRRQRRGLDPLSPNREEDQFDTEE